MKVIFTGGGSGGHYYPIIAIAEKLNELAIQEKILDLKLFYISDTPYDERALDDNNIKFIELKTGKKRIYFSIENYIDIFRTFFATIRAIFIVYGIYPDVIFSKGGYPSVPVTIAAKILKIPLIIHESDSVPGRANKMAARWAKRIAISYKESVEYFPKDKTAFVGNIVRKEVRSPLQEGAFEYLKLRSSFPIILILGGSQGAKIINDTVIDALPHLVKHYQIIHQTGLKNFEEVKIVSEVVLKDSEFKDNYYPYPYLNKLALRMSAGVCSIVVSRAGANSISEIASWAKPSIIIPITKTNGDHQRNNAYNYARTKACTVIEESNLKPSVLVSEIDRIFNDKDLMREMIEATQEFVFPDAEEKIAKEIIKIGLSHED
jgi:UDP-N-acetylglucosamine--N-acetylmuramyl-(pentapeptide) pyrophosphoryl-undecaprenol N-acetylglucosamine transferase